MKKIKLNPEELRDKIEQYLNSGDFKVILNITAIAQSGAEIQYVRFEGVFNYERILEIDIYFNGQCQPIISGFKGICNLNELIIILSEIKKCIDSL